MKVLAILVIYIAFPLVICERKCLGEFSKNQDNIPRGDRIECFNIMGENFADRKLYCVETTCPKPNCTEPIVPEQGCPFCKGTCVIGEQIVKAGEGTICPDGCNRCGCGADKDGNPMVWSTRMGCWNSEPPTECQDLAK